MLCTLGQRSCSCDGFPNGIFTSLLDPKLILDPLLGEAKIPT